MKYSGKWWDNPNRDEQERPIAYYAAHIFVGLIYFVIGIILIVNLC